jgi:hypothetical protein
MFDSFTIPYVVALPFRDGISRNSGYVVHANQRCDERYIPYGCTYIYTVTSIEIYAQKVQFVLHA